MTISRRSLEQIAAATVWFPRRKGHGVIVPGHFIVTAAHVITHRQLYLSAGLHDDLLESIEINGQVYTADVWFIDPIADVAVLGVPDVQKFAEASHFEDVLDQIRPVPISQAVLPFDRPIAVHLQRYLGRRRSAWITGQVTRFDQRGAHLSIDTKESITGGSSGGPVVSNQGSLLGVVSHTGGLPRIVTTVPRRLLETMIDPERDHRAWRRHVAPRLRARTHP
jgi:S1-C subfamily serine protease